MKKFNTAGPSIPGDHYMIDPLARLDLADIESLIEDKRYFVLHAPRPAVLLLDEVDVLVGGTLFRYCGRSVPATPSARKPFRKPSFSAACATSATTASTRRIRK